MRYSAIEIFSDGSFMMRLSNPGPSVYNYMLTTPSDEIKKFFFENKYAVIATDNNTYMLFREDHPMFNIILVRDFPSEPRQRAFPGIHARLKKLLTDFNV